MRITDRDLNEMVTAINEVKSGRKLQLYQAYGHTSVVEVMNENGGTRTLCGPGTGREMFFYLRGMLTALTGGFIK